MGHPTNGRFSKKAADESSAAHKNGQKVSTGIYFYRIRAGDFVEAKEVVVLEYYFG